MRDGSGSLHRCHREYTWKTNINDLLFSGSNCMFYLVVNHCPSFWHRNVTRCRALSHLPSDKYGTQTCCDRCRFCEIDIAADAFAAIAAGAAVVPVDVVASASCWLVPLVCVLLAAGRCRS